MGKSLKALKSNKKYLNLPANLRPLLATLLLLFFLSLWNENIHGQTLSLITKVKVENSTTCSITIYKNGQVSERHNNVKRKCRIEMQFGNEYSITFTQNGFRSKTLTVNTRNVPVHMQSELLDFGFEVSLDQKLLTKDATDHNQVVAHWFYHVEMGEFEYTYNQPETSANREAKTPNNQTSTDFSMFQPLSF